MDIVLASILVLTFADSIGHLFGIQFGKIPHPFVSTKFVEGWIAGFIAGFIGAIIFVAWYEALAASFFAMLVEGIEIKIGAEEVDDNLIIPLVAASAIWVVRLFF
jgi:dolichol kinase